jgi:D-arabinan exo alpha-(1,3)/(1,5)-arabinofuranosidase (non-reducing end)
MYTLSWLSDAQTRSISAENPTGEKGKGGMATTGTGAYAARDLGQGWKVSPSISIPSGATATLADIVGSGALQSFWFGGYTEIFVATSVKSEPGILKPPTPAW